MQGPLEGSRGKLKFTALSVKLIHELFLQEEEEWRGSLLATFSSFRVTKVRMVVKSCEFI